MTPTATYIAEENCLREEPRMEEPIPPRLSYNSQAGVEAAMKIIEATFSDYNAHLATLRKIPCDPSCKGLWADGQKVVDGKDYEVREMPAPRPEPIYETEEDWKQAQYEDRHELTQYVKKIPIALPLVPVKSEDEFNLHYEYVGMLAYYLGITINGKDLEDKAFPELKKVFSLTKR